MRTLACATVTLLLAPLLAGCGGSERTGTQVVASFYPLAFITEQIAGDHAEVVDLTKPGQEPHDLELSPVQVAQVADADLVVFSAGLQASVDAAVAQADAVPVVNAADHADLVPFAEEHADDGHVHGEEGLDPHFWLDPIRLGAVADAVADKLGQIDPDNSADYRANADALDERLDRLDQEFTNGLASCEITSIVVSHDAFSYWGKYGLTIHPIAGLSPDAEPTPADLAELSRLIASDSITTVFTERLAPADLSETLASDMGVTTAVLDPIEGLTDETAEEDYFSLMRANLAALEKANRCQ